MSAASDASLAPLWGRSAPLRWVFAACGVALGWVAADVVYAVTADSNRLRLLTSYLLPAFAGTVLLAVCRFGRLGPGPVSPATFFAGALFLGMAASFDLFATARSDPYLTLEGNPYIRVLIDETSHPIWAVYGHVLLTQVLFVGSFVASWWAFLRHRLVIVQSVQRSAPRTWPAFVKAATGGGKLTYRQWLFPFRPEEVPNPYHSVWPAALAVSFGTSFFRCWAAAEWLSIAPATTVLRIGVLIVGVGGTLALYYAWLAWHWRRDSRRE